MESSGHYFGAALECAILEVAHMRAFQDKCTARTPAVRFTADAHFHASRYYSHHADNNWSLCGMVAKTEAASQEAQS